MITNIHPHIVFKRQDKNPTGEMFTRSYNPHERVVYSITRWIDMDVYFVLSVFIIVNRKL